MEQPPEDNRPAPIDLEQIRAMLQQLSAAERKAFIAHEAAELLTPEELAEVKAKGHYRSNVRLLHNLSRSEQATDTPARPDRALASAAQVQRNTARLPELPNPALPPAPNRISRPSTLADPTPPKARPKPIATRNSPWLDRSLLAVEWLCALVIVAILAQWVYAQFTSEGDGNNVAAQSASLDSDGRAAASITLTTTLPPSPTPVPPTPTSRPSNTPVPISEPSPNQGPSDTPTLTPTLPPIPTATAIPAIPISDALPLRIVIPKIKVDSKVVEVQLRMDTWQVADYAVGHHENSALPGQQGNTVMAGHRDIRGSVFRNLDKIGPKDEILVYTKNKVYRYRVTSTRIVKPTEVSVMAQTDDYRLTLITCTPIGIASHRIIVVAQLVDNDVPVIGGEP